MKVVLGLSARSKYVCLSCVCSKNFGTITTRISFALQGALTNFGLVSAGNDVIIVGGYSYAGPGAHSTVGDTWRYTYTTNTWTRLSAMPTARAAFGAVWPNEKILRECVHCY
eukprot:m.314624 g.314624  ORF g.314624 m.314624 type:complete len:112 (+) comp16494_c4_seq17:423-758(+)